MEQTESGTDDDRNEKVGGSGSSSICKNDDDDDDDDDDGVDQLTSEHEAVIEKGDEGGDDDVEFNDKIEQVGDDEEREGHVAISEGAISDGDYEKVNGLINDDDDDNDDNGSSGNDSGEEKKMEGMDDEGSKDDEGDSEHDSENDRDHEDENQNEVSNRKIHRDESGRELSAYEIMRLERIQRNRAYLAQLGLEGENNQVRGSLEKEIQQKKKKKKAAVAGSEEITPVERRKCIARKSKTKSVDYSGDLINLINPLNAEAKAKAKQREKSPNPVKHKKKRDMVPRFIYLEFEHMRKTKNKAVAAAKRIVKIAEVECRIAKRNLEIHEKRKNKRKVEPRNERKSLLATKRMLEPTVEELDKRREDLMQAIKDFDEWNDRTSIELKERTAKMNQTFTHAKTEFPRALERNERELGFLLRERLMRDEETKKEESAKKKKKKRKLSINEAEGIEKSADSSKCIKTPTKNNGNKNDLNNKSPNIGDNSSLKKPKKNAKTRNVGGPVTASLATSLQRKWLERDTPIPVDISTDFVPQVGDTILYYPCAHYEFLQECPDVRCKKLRLALRKPLWERAKEERNLLEKSKTVNIEQLSKKEKILLNSKPWWTSEWIKSIEEKGAIYPIVCRVEKVVAEFPYDAESMKALRRSKYKSKKAQEGKESENAEESNDHTKRRPVMRKKPTLGLSVTLRPLSTISAPKLLADRNDTFF